MVQAKRVLGVKRVSIQRLFMYSSVTLTDRVAMASMQNRISSSDETFPSMLIKTFMVVASNSPKQKEHICLYIHLCEPMH